MRRHRRLIASLALLAIAALPVVADRLRAGSDSCAMDGVRVTTRFRVRVLGADGASHSFCGVRCADRWLARARSAPQAIFVTACGTGRELEAERAHFLYTITGWAEGVPDFVRVFARRADAERHAKAHGGEILMGSERPLSYFTDRCNDRP